MEFVVVNFPEPRTARSGGVAIGPTGQMLAINGGFHTFTLSDPQDYIPPSQRLVVANTSVANPLNVTFAPTANWLAANFPPVVLTLANAIPTVDGTIAHLAPLGLAWQVEKNGAFGMARATAVLKADPHTGETWIVAALEHAAAAKHRHNPGGPYGEILVTLAGELSDQTDAGQPVMLKPTAAISHAANTVHAPSASVFWAGVYYQPFGATPSL